MIIMTRMETQGDLIAKIVQIAFMLFVLSIYLYRRQKKNTRGYEWFIGAVFFGLLQSLIEIIFFAIGDIPNESVIAQIDGIPYAILLMFLLLHFEYFLGVKFYNLFIASSLMAVYIATYFIELSLRLESNLGIDVNKMVFNLVFYIYQLYIFIVCVISSIYMLVKTRKTKIWPQTLVFALSFIVMLGTAITELIQNYAGFEFYGAIGFGIAIFILSLIYIIFRSFVYVSATPISSFLIVHKDGPTLFACDYGKRGSLVDSILVGGGISAFVTFLREVTNIKDQSIQTIELDKSAIMVKEHKELFGVLFAPKRMKLLANSIEHFTIEFHKYFEEELKNFRGSTGEFRKAVDLLPKIFVYLDKDKLYPV